jgi:putative tryptophan/tyrosine transport system substrate-binding protein
MTRRDFIAGISGALALPLAGPFVAKAQQQMRRIGVLNSLSADDPVGQKRMAAFLQGLQQAGWTVGQNVQMDLRWAAGQADDYRSLAAELIALQPDVILATGSAAVGTLQTTRTVPIVFVNVIDPVGAGFVESLARPGGNVTGFTQFEYATSGKWLELLKEIAPRVTRAAVLRDYGLPSGLGQFAAVQSAAPALGIEVRPVNVRDATEITRAISAFTAAPNGGLIVTANASTVLHRELIISLAARHKLPAVYSQKFFVSQGGLASYGPELREQYRLAAGYVDRILKGEKPADLPVQSATKYELAVNRKTARGLGLTVPPALLARADEVLE